MRTLRRLAASAAGVALVLAGAPAAAGDTGDIGVMAGPCGSSYTHVGHHELRDDASNVFAGYFDIYWSTSTKRNCLVVNASGPSYGYKAMKQANIKFSDQPHAAYELDDAKDLGLYRYYAGPVYTMAGVNGSGRCVDVIGKIVYPGGTAAKELTELHCG